MASKTIRIWEGVDQSKTKNMWGSQSISNINSTIASNISGNYKISSATINVYADFDGAGGLANVYMKYGFGSTNSISTQLGGERKLTKDSTNYPNDITSYLSSDKKGISTSYGSYFVANVYTSNVVVGSSGALHISYVELVVNYDLYYTVSTKATPENGGTITGGGSYANGSSATLKATANSGYKFVKWSDNVTTATRTVTVTSDVTYTAVFAVDKILIGTAKPTAIYLDETNKVITFVVSGTIANSGIAGADTVDGYHIAISNSAPSSGARVSAVYIDTTKAYG